MTDVNPTPTPEPKASQQLTGFWNSLSKNAKIAIAVVAVIIVFAIAGSGGSGKSNSTNNTSTTQDTSYTQPTSNPSADYANWKSRFSPIFSTVISDYQQTITDLSNADEASVRVDFVSLSQDAIDMSNNADSPDSNLNSVIEQFSADLGVLAGEGEQSLNNIDAGGDMTQGFSDASTAIGNDIASLNDALTSANSTY